MKLTDLFEDTRYKIRYYNKDGKRHRTDGPARIWANGIKEWWINGKYYGDGDKPPQEWIDAGGKYEAD